MELENRISKRIFEVEQLVTQLKQQLFACDVLLGELRELLKEDDTASTHATSETTEEITEG